jgi:hypothetical protein
VDGAVDRWSNGFFSGGVGSRWAWADIDFFYGLGGHQSPAADQTGFEPRPKPTLNGASHPSPRLALLPVIRQRTADLSGILALPANVTWWMNRFLITYILYLDM